jgi:hypothetical protein
MAFNRSDPRQKNSQKPPIIFLRYFFESFFHLEAIDGTLLNHPVQARAGVDSMKQFRRNFNDKT